MADEISIAITQPVTEVAVAIAANGQTGATGATGADGSDSEGDVTKVATPANNEIGVWTGDGTIKGDSNFKWDGKSLDLTQSLTGSEADEAINLVTTWNTGGDPKLINARVTATSVGSGALLVDFSVDGSRVMSLDPSGNLHVAGNLELGHESDTTLSRSSAGVLAVEGVNAQLVSGATALETVAIACSDETTDLTTGTAKATFRMPFAMTLTEVRASVTTAPVGSTIIVDINEGGSTILSTKLTIDASEKTSTTAATPAVISDSALADDAEITIDIDQIGSGTAGAGLKVTLIGYRT